MEAEPVNIDQPLTDDYAAYLGAMRMTSELVGFEYPLMTESQFRQACEDSGYVFTSVIEMDAFEQAYRS